MTTVGAYEARTHLARLLDRAASGERFLITRHGVPVAVLAPPPTAERPDVRAAVARLKRFRKGRALRGLTVREMIEEGRRF